MRSLALALVLVAGCTSFSTTGAPTSDDAGAVVHHDAAAPTEQEAGAVPDASPDPTGDAGPDFALDLKGSGFVDVPSLEIPTTFTLEAWILPSVSEPGREQDILAKDRNGDSTAQCRLVIRADNTIYFNGADSNGNSHGLTTGGNNTRNLATSKPITLGVWTHVAVTKQGTVMQLFINGDSVSTVTIDAAFAFPSNDVHFRIGARNDSGTNNDNPDSTFVGSIDDVRVWSIARSASDIQATMHAGALPAGTGGLVADFPFSEGSGSVTASSTGTYSGTLTGGHWIASTR